MIRCSNCGRPLPELPRPILCRQCASGSSLLEDDPGPWSAIARFENAAEAGYYAECLQAQGIVTRLEYHDRFDAAKDHWQMLFELQVHPEQREEALACLRRELNAAEHVEGQSFPADDAAGTTEAIWCQPHRYESLLAGGDDGGLSAVAKWLPFLVLAGSVGFVGGWWCAQRQLPSTADSAFWYRAAQSAPWLSSSKPGQPSQRLNVDWSKGEWFLEEDRDGDGRFESVWRAGAPALPIFRLSQP